MKYDFDTVIDRRHTHSLKWDVAEGELPMWVADMDFPAAPEILAELQKILDRGIFGYAVVPDDWADAYIDWWSSRHHFTMQREWLIFSAGVVPTISSAVRKLTTPAEKVVLLTPCYNIFFNSVQNNGRIALECPLLYRPNGYDIDWELLEEDLADPQSRLLLLCNPHNPTGRIWTRQELSRIGELAARHDVIVLSDEIHCDLTDPGKEYIPFACVSEICAENSITAVSPTKAFNLAGIQTSAAVVANPSLRHRLWRALNTDEVAEPNVFAAEAADAAFRFGSPWLDQLREYLAENKKTAKEFLAKNCPQITVQPAEATYLLWLFCRPAAKDVLDLCEFIRKDSGLYLSYGGAYGRGGEDFIRINVACPRSVLLDGLQRFARSLSRYQSGKRS